MWGVAYFPQMRELGMQPLLQRIWSQPLHDSVNHWWNVRPCLQGGIGPFEFPQLVRNRSDALDDDRRREGNTSEISGPPPDPIVPQSPSPPCPGQVRSRFRVGGTDAVAALLWGNLVTPQLHRWVAKGDYATG
ncbi:hypothetical protein GCM10009527_047770 [Actinomadura nitritigenes]